MSAEKTMALTLRTLDFSETSQIVTFYSRGAGRMTLLAKGSRRKRHGVQTSIDLLQAMEIVYLDRSASQLGLLTEFALKEDFPGLRRDIERGYAGFFVAEIIRTLTEERDPDPEIYDLAVETLRLLETTGAVETVTHAFEVKFLRIIGLLPRFDGCASCGADIGETPEVAFAASSGGTICAECAKTAVERLSVSRGALAMLAKLASTASNRVERLRISGRIAGDVRRVLARTWLSLLGREPEMIRRLAWMKRSDA